MSSQGANKLKLDDTTLFKLLDCIQEGLTLESSCSYVGISYHTFKRWLNTGQKEIELQLPISEYGRLYTAYKATEAIAEANLIRKLMASGARDWRAPAWILERRYPKNWRASERKELTGADGTPLFNQENALQPDLSKLTNEEIDQLIHLLNKAGIEFVEDKKET